MRFRSPNTWCSTVWYSSSLLLGFRRGLRGQAKGRRQSLRPFACPRRIATTDGNLFEDGDPVCRPARLSRSFYKTGGAWAALRSKTSFSSFRCARLSRSFHKTGGAWAALRSKTSFSSFRCARLSRSFHKTGCASATLRSKTSHSSFCCARLSLSLSPEIKPREIPLQVGEGNQG